MTEPTQFGDNVAAEMRAYFEAHKREKWVEGTADNLMLGLFNIAIRAIEATRSSVTADDALRDDAEWLVTAAGHLQRCCEQSYSRSTMTPVSTGTLVDIADRLERIASRLCSPSPDGE